MSATRKPLLPVDEALALLLHGAEPLGVETIALEDAHNRILASDLFAKRTQPPFAASAMDGYAVRALDAAHAGATLKVIGDVAAGYMFDGVVGAGECVRIFTGAPLPDGTDAILIQEDAEPAGESLITVTETVTSGTYVRPAGLDFSDGDILLSQGRVLDAGALCLAASGNHASLPVYKKPRIGILATGDELLAPGSTLKPGQIIASNAYGVGAIASEYHAEVIDLGIARDDEKSLKNALQSAIDSQCDVLITLGGASVGEHDLVRSVFISAGMELDFWKIAMQPGKPLMFGKLGNMRILGLPGNPVSSLVCTHLFGVPLICALGGRSYNQVRQKAKLTGPIKANGNREQYARAMIKRTDSGFEASVFENQDSSIISFYANANGLVVRPIDAPAAIAGDDVEFIALTPIGR
ncbi:gephyrin-like molybdotransferase Glp [Ahrensia sp. 13_GOM-1096m]|uniref:molybdopterin molybdotransferase MoeA n=1 Tax=Ahrensia sp. 13_GOM-1096m TaxID=1380380 RepID=UPI000479A3F9|nr:gephyrin-like molybdotransferase Glp [Ahrensia sp. 13_GOM-1096m]